MTIPNSELTERMRALQEQNAVLRAEVAAFASSSSEVEPRSRLAYQQNFEHLRHLNAQMNAVPTFAMTLTGGLWFGAGLTTNLDSQIRFALLMFAGIANVSLITVVIRIRDVLQSYLELVQDFFPPAASFGTPRRPLLKGMTGYSMISVYAVLLLTAALLSFFGGIWYYWPFSGVSRFYGALGAIAFNVLLVSVVFATAKSRT